ncbi:MAG: pyruvate formate lyase family protein, partial [Clostridia bacterium]|nr:pyruvate formate lyase family protein [Clostridia bacterium]
ENPNEFSKLVLKSAVMNNMAQPQITVLLKPEASEEFTKEVFAAMNKLVDKLHIYNYDLIVNALIKKGISPEDAKKFTFSACCTFDLNYYSYRLEYYTPTLQIFLDVINSKEYSDLEHLAKDLTAALKNDIQNDIENKEKGFSDKEYARKCFMLDCLLHTDTAYKGIYPCDGNSKYKIFNVFCPGVATLGDSLMVLDKLVFKEKRFSYNEFVEILNNNYENQEELRREILNYTRFGNDSDADEYTVIAANSFLDAVDELELKENYYAIGGFYSLERDNTWTVRATPDGRKDGEPFSENQSPTYGADKNGITALLKSLSKLPFERTVTGGLNLTFSQNVSADILKALAVSYFKLGGLHIGISVINAETLKDAMKNPDKYKSLTVRLYGFSEYFVSLPKWQQMAVLKRTQY